MIAKRKTFSAYRLWREALGVGWKDYLLSLQETSGCGVWVKEVANYLPGAGCEYEEKV